MLKPKLVSVIMLSLVCSVQANEKVYLHLDQNAYYLDETIRFCAYVNDTETNRPTELSRVLYVELLSPEGDVVKNLTCKLEEGKASGCIKAEKSLLSGLFELRAYTRYMCNWADNYYSRIIPIFEAAADGNYTKRTMLKRRRSVMTEKEQQEYEQTVNDAKAKTTKTADKATPVRLSMAQTANKLKPNEKVVLKFHGEPNTTFSLSVKDADNDIAASGNDNIVDGLVKNNDWQAAEMLSSQNNQSQHFVEPDKGITLRGKLMLRRDYLKPIADRPDAGIANTPIRMVRETDEWIDTARVVTDEKGWFQVLWGDVYGDRMATLYPQGDNSEQRVIMLDKWFSPKPRNYPDVVYKKWNKSMIGATLPYPYKRIDINEELEWLIDNDKLVGENYVDGLGFDDLEGIMLHDHYNLLNKEKSVPYRSLFLDRPYPGDSIVPESGMVSDSYFQFVFDKYKSIVIRTDSAICEKYSYTNYPPKEQEANYASFTPSSRDGAWMTQKGLGTEYTSNDEKDKPSMIVCYIPCGSRDDDITYRNKSTRIRNTVIHGFTTTAASENNGGYRRTLYWNPNVRTDENGDATIEFQNSSTCKRLHISAEGITQDGRPIEYKNH